MSLHNFMDCHKIPKINNMFMEHSATTFWDFSHNISPPDNSPTDYSSNGQFTRKYCFCVKIYEFMHERQKKYNTLCAGAGWCVSSPIFLNVRDHRGARWGGSGMGR